MEHFFKDGIRVYQNATEDEIKYEFRNLSIISMVKLRTGQKQDLDGIMMEQKPHT